MEIKILQNTDWRYGQYLKGSFILEKSEYDSEFSSIKRIRYDLLDIETNERTELLPNIEKYNIGDIINVSINSDYIYFINLFKNDDNDTVTIIRYNIITKETESLYSYSEKIDDFNVTKRLKIFVINDLYLIMQTEYLVENHSQTYAGFFRFDLKMYNLKDKAEYVITDDNFVKNGISDIVPISETQAIIKTGFSLLEDNRYNALEQDECSLESLSFVNISQMISDLMLNNASLSLETIEQAYYTRTISYIRKSKDYLIYSCINNETKEEEVKFYNLNTKDVKSCINQDVIRTSDLANPYVINSEPYVCIMKNNNISFLSLNTNKIELSNNKGMILRKVLDDSVIFSGVSTSIFSKKIKPFFDIISFPQGKLLLHEQSEYVDSFIDDNNTIYIIVR